MSKSNQPARTHSSVVSRPEEKMSHEPDPYIGVFSYGKPHGKELIGKGTRKVLKHSGNKKRRQRGQQ